MLLFKYPWNTLSTPGVLGSLAIYFRRGPQAKSDQDLEERGGVRPPARQVTAARNVRGAREGCASFPAWQQELQKKTEYLMPRQPSARRAPIKRDAFHPPRERARVLGSVVSLFLDPGPLRGQKAEGRLAPLSFWSDVELTLTDFHPSPRPAETKRSLQNIPAPNVRLY